MAIDKSLRHFERFRANIEISVHIPTQESLKLYSSTEFICAFSLRGLIACVRPRTYMPSKFCDCSVTFDVIPEDLPDTFNPHRHPLCMPSYEQITAMIVRNIVFVLANETRLSYFKNGLI